MSDDSKLVGKTSFEPAHDKEGKLEKLNQYVSSFGLYLKSFIKQSPPSKSFIKLPSPKNEDPVDNLTKDPTENQDWVTLHEPPSWYTDKEDVVEVEKESNKNKQTVLSVNELSVLMSIVRTSNPKEPPKCLCGKDYTKYPKITDNCTEECKKIV